MSVKNYIYFQLIEKEGGKEAGGVKREEKGGGNKQRVK